MTTAPNTKPVLILMADDDPEDCLLTKKTLQKSRLANELRFVQDGQELLDYLGRSGKFSDPGSSPRPDLILLDLNMPNMAGLDSLWEINLKPALRKIPIVILTASEASLDISDSYNLGAYAYLVKPVTFTKLHEAVLRLKSCSYELTVPAGPGDAVRPAVIVMADDDPEDCLQATKTLQAAGLGNALTYVTNGAALLDHLQGRHLRGDGTPTPRPDLVILDPGLATDGGAACARRDRRHAGAPRPARDPAGRIQGRPCRPALGGDGRAGLHRDADRFHRLRRRGCSLSVARVATRDQSRGAGRHSRRRIDGRRRRMARPETSERTVLLMADDDPADCLLTEKALRRADITCPLYVVHDGAELLDYLRRRGDYADPEAAPRPSLILLDLNMPKVNGTEVLEQLRDEPELCRIPVVVLDDLRRGAGHRGELRARRQRLHGQALGLRRHGLGRRGREGPLAGDGAPAALSAPVTLRQVRPTRRPSRPREPDASPVPTSLASRGR